MNSGLRHDLVAADGPLAGTKITDVSSVGGGCIHQAWQLRLSDGRQLFAKTGTADAFDLFEVEAEALTALGQYADSDVLVVPQPLSWFSCPMVQFCSCHGCHWEEVISSPLDVA